MKNANFELIEYVVNKIKTIDGCFAGSGIFVSPSQALQRSGSVGLCLIVWMVSGALSLLCALTFAELSTVVPRSGAEYVYFVEAFSPLHRYWGQLPGFLCSWISVMILRPAEVAVVILTFAEYLIQPFSGYLGCLSANQTLLLKRLIAALALSVMTYINVMSVKLYVRVQNVFTVSKVAACILVIIGGIYWLGSGHTEHLQKPFQNTTTNLGNIALAFYSGLWAYDGWNYAAIVTEEMKKPEKNILRSILIAVPIVTILYVAMNLMYMSALSYDEMTQAPAVAVTWAERVFPAWLRFAIPLGVAMSTFGCGLSLQFGVSRMCYVAGSEGHLPTLFSFIHITKMTPVAAVTLQGILSFICIFLGGIAELIEFASFLMWVFYGSAMVALLVFRKTRPHANRPYRVPTFIPWLVLCITVFLSVTPIVSEPSPKHLISVFFILSGMILYHFYVYKKMTSKFFGNSTRLFIHSVSFFHIGSTVCFCFS